MGVKASSNTKYPIGFPKLMIRERDSAVVLFVSEKKGMAIREGIDSTPIIGSYREAWCMDDFINYNGSITLENE